MSYVIFGKRIASEYLSIGTLTLVGVGSWLAMRGNKAADAAEKSSGEPQITANSSAEEAFIRDYVKREGGKAQLSAGSPPAH
ncbi:hypothetical protein NEOLI_001954 [Neolecta irregularis DAH-3]|uniref:ATP synthase subunit K, mitochondrial n=1 Tax=Neolecta irregularis (strain DAH-3) TaxID=1198029 RepID=A0A1U7LX04_NEOID|nr:hypothetical protein NEOLI_001954 [Neolecta irregularis DAH-3]|eukprot:OLL27158.1 hypothetical protein NEOLI_001954 [Neolecta irregularis DAH-3]